MSIVRRDINGFLAELGRWYTLLFYFSEKWTLSYIIVNISNILVNIVTDWDGDHNKHTSLILPLRGSLAWPAATDLTLSSYPLQVGLESPRTPKILINPP